MPLKFQLLSILIFILFLLPSYIIFGQEVNIVQNFSLYFQNYDYFFNKGSDFLLLSEINDDSIFLNNTLILYSISFIYPGIRGLLSLQNVLIDQSTPYLSFKILQAWIKVNLGNGWGISFGKKISNSMECYFKNPSDIINNKLKFGDNNQLEGRDIFEILGVLNIFGLPLDLTIIILFPDDISKLEKLPIYLAIGTIIYPFEIKFKSYLQKDYKPFFSGVFKFSLNNVNIYFDSLYYSINDIPITVERQNKDYFKYLAGISFPIVFANSSIIKAINIIIEFYHRDDGLTYSEAENYYKFLEQLSNSNPSEYLEEISSFEFFDLYKNYIFFNINFNILFIKNIDITFYCILNLEDYSFFIKPEISFEIKRFFNIIFSYFYFYGDKYSEAGQYPYYQILSLTLSKEF